MNKNLPVSLLVFILSGVISTNTYAQLNKLLIGDNNHSQIVISNTDGSSLDTLNIPNQSYYDADIDPINHKIYISHYWGIFSMNYDGTAFDTIVYNANGSYSDGITVDANNGFVYWGDTQEKKIYRSDLDGENIAVFYNTTGFVTDIDLDLLNNKIYFGQFFSAAKGLYSIDLEETILDTINNTYDIQYIGVDNVHNKLYFGDQNNGKCRSINFDGTNDNLLFNFNGGGFFVDIANALLYTADMTNNNVVVSNLDGSNSSNIFAEGILESPHGPLLLSDITTGIQKSITSNFTIFPNPTTDHVTVTFTESISGTVSIVDLKGNVVATKAISENTSNISTANLASGVYVVKINSDKGVAVKQLVVQ